MASADQITGMVALLLFQNIREGMQNGRVADLDAAKNEVDSAIAELNRVRIPEERACFNVEIVAQLLLELGSTREKVAKCEAQLADFENQAKLIKEDTAQLAARADACNLLAQQQQKENAKVLAAMEDAKASAPTVVPPHCAAPAPSPTDPVLRAAPSKTAVVSFPGGPRTITIHPPHSPNYQSIIRDATGDVIIDFRRAKPLRREGAFRGSLEDINWHEITPVRGRAPEFSGVRAPVPPVPHWPDHSQSSAGGPALSRTPAEIVARQRQLSTSLKTDSFKRILAPEDLADTNPSSQLSNGSSSTTPRVSQDSQSSSTDKQVTPLSTPGDEEQHVTKLSEKLAVLEQQLSISAEKCSRLDSILANLESQFKELERNGVIRMSQMSQTSPRQTGQPIRDLPSPSAGRGKKRARDDEDNGGVLLTANARDEGARMIDQQTVKEPVTPTPVKHEESYPPEGPAKRKRLCSSTSSETLQPSGSTSRPLTRTYSLLNVTQTI